MKLTLPSARTAFVVHLEAPAMLAADIARIEHVIHLFRGYNIPATWVVATRRNYDLLRQRDMLRDGDELALAITPTETGAANFRDSLRNRLTTVLQNHSVAMVAGEPSTFRTHAAFLGEQGLRGVLSNSKKRPGTPGYAPLPCGLWQLDYALAMPGQSLFATLLPGSNASRRFHKLILEERTVTISIDAARIAHTSTRCLQQLDQMLRNVSLSISHAEIALITAGKIVSELTASRAARPQHSILRAA